MNYLSEFEVEICKSFENDNNRCEKLDLPRLICRIRKQHCCLHLKR